MKIHWKLTFHDANKVNHGRYSTIKGKFPEGFVGRRGTKPPVETTTVETGACKVALRYATTPCELTAAFGQLHLGVE